MSVKVIIAESFRVAAGGIDEIETGGKTSVTVLKRR